MQDFGDQIRKEKGSAYLAEELIKDIRAGKHGDASFVVDSIRNSAEITAFRRESFFSVSMLTGKHAGSGLLKSMTTTGRRLIKTTAMTWGKTIRQMVSM